MADTEIDWDEALEKLVASLTVHAVADYRDPLVWMDEWPEVR